MLCLFLANLKLFLLVTLWNVIPWILVCSIFFPPWFHNIQIINFYLRNWAVCVWTCFIISIYLRTHIRKHQEKTYTQMTWPWYDQQPLATALAQVQTLHERMPWVTREGLRNEQPAGGSLLKVAMILAMKGRKPTKSKVNRGWNIIKQSVNKQDNHQNPDYFIYTLYSLNYCVWLSSRESNQRWTKIQQAQVRWRWSHLAPSIWGQQKPHLPVKNTNGGIMKRLKPQLCGHTIAPQTPMEGPSSISGRCCCGDLWVSFKFKRPDCLHRGF